MTPRAANARKVLREHASPQVAAGPQTRGRLALAVAALVTVVALAAAAGCGRATDGVDPSSRSSDSRQTNSSAPSTGQVDGEPAGGSALTEETLLEGGAKLLDASRAGLVPPVESATGAPDLRGLLVVVTPPVYRDNNPDTLAEVYERASGLPVVVIEGEAGQPE